jgi:hypothetical protein
VYACYETDLTPWEGGDLLIAVFDNEKDAKAFVTKLDKNFGNEYVTYTYEILELNKSKYSYDCL